MGESLNLGFPIIAFSTISGPRTGAEGAGKAGRLPAALGADIVDEEDPSALPGGSEYLDGGSLGTIGRTAL